ncbi:MAG: cobalamin biosynthesis protein [Thermoleophilaceae bacterium]
MVRSAGLALAMALDAALRDPATLHPVAGLGRIAHVAERRLYRPTRAAGALYAAALVVPPAALALGLDRRAGRGASLMLTAACAWTALGGASLRRIALQMADLVDAGDLTAARALARSLVARRTGDLDGAELSRAALESLAENTSDAVGGPIVWTAAAGPAGAVAHRTVNTLDAMVGYRDGRYERFGWASARLDDLINWPVARATAAATVGAAALCGEDPAGAVRVWRHDGARHPSPNAGRVEAAFAGALGVRLGGTNLYGDRAETRPPLGDGRWPDTVALRRGVRLSATASWLLAAAAVGVTAAVCAWR